MITVPSGIRSAQLEYELTFKHRGDLSLQLQLNGNQRVRLEALPSALPLDRCESPSVRRFARRRA